MNAEQRIGSPAAEAPTGEKVTAEFQQTGAPLHDMVHRRAEASATSDDQIHAMCAYGRGMECKKCPARVDTPYGNGQPGCHAVAEETLKKARDILRTDSGVTEDAARYRWLREQSWVFCELERMNSAIEYETTDGQFVDDAIDAARMSKGERG